MLETNPELKKESNVEHNTEHHSELSPNGIEIMNSINEKIESEEENLSIEVEQKVGAILKEVDASPSTYQKMSREVQATFKKSNIKKLVAGLTFTLLSQMPAFGANAENPSDAELLSSDSVETKAETSIDDLSDAATPFDGPNEGEESLEEGSRLEDDPTVHTFESKADFEIAKTDLDPAELEALHADIENFVDGFNAEDLEKIKSGQMILQFEAGSSPEKIISEIETSMGSVDNNYDLSQARADIFKAQVLEQLAEKGINNPLTSITIPVIEGIEPGVSEDGERFASVTGIELTNENIAEYMDIIVLDKSGSMEDDVNEINNIIEQKDLGTEVISVKTESSNTETFELHLETMLETVKNAKEGSNIFFMTDEKDDYGHDDFDNYQDKHARFMEDMKELRAEAKLKNINIIGKMNNIEKPAESITFDYLDLAPMLLRGSDDVDTYNKLKKHLEWKANN